MPKLLIYQLRKILIPRLTDLESMCLEVVTGVCVALAVPETPTVPRAGLSWKLAATS